MKNAKKPQNPQPKNKPTEIQFPTCMSGKVLHLTHQFISFSKNKDKPTK